MENNLQVKTYKVDYEFLRNNYLDPKVWDFVATIFTYKDIKSDIKLHSINVTDKVLVFSLTTWYTRNDSNSSMVHTINYPLDREDFTSKLFQNKVNATLKRALSDVAYNKATRLAEDKFYSDMESERSYLEDLFDDLYKDLFPSELSYYIEDVRDRYVDNNERIVFKRNKYRREIEELYRDEYLKIWDLMVQELQSTPETKKEINIEIPKEVAKEIEVLMEDFEELSYEEMVEKYDLEEPEEL